MAVKTVIKDGLKIYGINPFGELSNDGLVTKKLITTFGIDNISVLTLETQNKLIDVGNSTVLGSGKVFEIDMSDVVELNDIILY